MLRIILYRATASDNWNEGVFHLFSGSHAVIENRSTGEISLVPVGTTTLKFKVPTEQWMAMQAQAQQDAKVRSVQAGGIPLDSRR